jgi:hypothetical protein
MASLAVQPALRVKAGKPPLRWADFAGQVPGFLGRDGRAGRLAHDAVQDELHPAYAVGVDE